MTSFQARFKVLNLMCAARRTRIADPGRENLGRTAITVLLVGGLTLEREGLLALLESSEAVKVIGKAANARDACHLAGVHDPAVIVMALGMSEITGIGTIREVHDAYVHSRILLLARRTDVQMVFDCLQAGAAGVMLMSSDFAELTTAIHAIEAKGAYLSPGLAEAVQKDYFRQVSGGSSNGSEMLTKPEREVLYLIAEGYSARQAGKALHMSPRTVDSHRHNIMKKLGIRSIAGLTRFAIRHGLCSV